VNIPALLSQLEEPWKAELRDRYERMPDAEWFLDAHEGKSLGSAVGIDE
jgi:hypothetical protein